MTFWLPAIVSAIYAVTGAVHAYRQNWWWAVVWWGYAAAQVGLCMTSNQEVQ